ncbi:hypothetical protein [Pseudoalteromonas marina]|uniref:hypothetical protein n=1 Tax=Pseudoalteromonas marina TaxID=267375 RepID=UPI003C3307C3
MNGNPTKKQKDFHDWCREQGCIISGDIPVIHHIKGSKMKLKGCDKPGEWYVIPLADKYHSPYSKNSVHENKKQFERDWMTEKQLWIELMKKYERQFNELPLSFNEYQIIKERA